MMDSARARRDRSAVARTGVADSPGERPVRGARAPGDDDVDWTWTDGDSSWIPPEIDAERASPARMYDYALGGKDNFAVDRAAVEAIGELAPDLREVALANRGFLVRAVDAMARLGVDQFIDVGTGIPASPNVHEVAQQVDPQVRVVYVDNDPVVMAHNRALRGRRPGVLTLDRDLRHPASILGSTELHRHLDLERPVGLLFVGVLHFVRRDLAVEVLNQFRRALPAGSYLAISTLCADGMDMRLVDRLETVYGRSSSPLVPRTTDQVEQLFEGVELLPPGLTDVTAWRTHDSPKTVRVLAGVGRIGGSPH